MNTRLRPLGVGVRRIFAPHCNADSRRYSHLQPARGHLGGLSVPSAGIQRLRRGALRVRVVGTRLMELFFWTILRLDLAAANCSTASITA